MSHNKTHTEIRNEAENRELIEITDEMRSAMQKAFEADAQRLGVDEAPRIDDRRNNFRPYDQRQRFFVDVSKDSFLEENIRRASLIWSLKDWICRICTSSTPMRAIRLITR